jgi:hypothetical protein
MFYFNQFLHNLSNFILIRFKGIEANYLYVYQTNFIFKISHIFFTFHSEISYLMLYYFFLKSDCTTL